MQITEWLDTQLGQDIWNKKYRYNNESFDEWLDRVSGGNADIRRLIVEKKFLFGGRTLANRGIPNSGSFSNCYSIGYVPDSLDGIMDVAQKIALTFKAQGGQGLSLSKIRPKGCVISDRFQSDGIIPFMQIFNTVTKSVSQGGSRKGALLVSLDVWHKEILDFIKIKENLNEINNANLSVEIDDEFMQNLGKTIPVKRKYGNKTIEYNINTEEVFNSICESAWKSAEPGIIFTNRFRNYNIMERVVAYNIETCNPCGEQPLPKHGACNLCSINLSEYVLNPFTPSAAINFEALKTDIPHIVRAMDDVLTENLNNHALEEQIQMATTYRNLGIGIMGLADMFVKLGITYGSIKSVSLSEQLMQFIFRQAVRASSKLGAERGNFPGYNPAVWNSSIINKAFHPDEIQIFKDEDTLRNCSLLSIAPAGSIGTMLGVSTGCEPFFALSYNRRTVSLNGNQEKTYKVNISVLDEYLKQNNTPIPDYFVTSHDIHWSDRIAVQAALQNFCDTAISSTINLPKEVTLDEVKELYKLAWDKGLKGVTIYKDGSRDAILSTDNTSKPSSFSLDCVTTMSRDDLGQVLKGETYKYHTACGTLYITVNKDSNGNIVEIFTNSSKNGTCKANLNGETRLASLALRAGVKTEEVIDTLKSIQCQSCVFAKAKGTKIDGTSCPDIISKCLKQAYSNKTAQSETNYSEKCPECGNVLTHEGGCVQCTCGYSKCN